MTLIYQSYRTENVPEWIGNCLGSVRDWSEMRGYEYRFIGDEMFGYAPTWYRKKVRDNVQLVSDLSRLILAKHFLEEGYERVIWIDADLLVFDPESFFLDTTEGAHFCREVWVDADRQGNIVHQEKINNSISIFHKGNSLLEFYTDACLRLVEKSSELPPVLVGTSFLTALQKIYPFSVIRNVGILSPALIYGFLKKEEEFVEKYLQWHGSEIFAANLCGSMKDQLFRGLEINEQTMQKVVDRLTKTKRIGIRSIRAKF